MYIQFTGCERHWANICSADKYSSFFQKHFIPEKHSYKYMLPNVARWFGFGGGFLFWCILWPWKTWNRKNITNGTNFSLLLQYQVSYKTHHLSWVLVLISGRKPEDQMLINQKQIPPLEQRYITNLKNRANYLTTFICICLEKRKTFHNRPWKLEQRTKMDKK